MGHRLHFVFVVGTVTPPKAVKKKKKNAAKKARDTFDKRFAPAQVPSPGAAANAGAGTDSKMQL